MENKKHTGIDSLSDFLRYFKFIPDFIDFSGSGKPKTSTTPTKPIKKGDDSWTDFLNHCRIHRLWIFSKQHQ